MPSSAATAAARRPDLDVLLKQGLAATPHPTFAGAVVGVDDGHDRVVTSAGLARQYADRAGTPLPEDEQVAVTDETLFDLASLTKLFTATVITALSERGLLDLDEPLHRFFESYEAPDRDRVTVRPLLTHTSGLPPTGSGWRDVPNAADRPAAVLATPLVAEPGTRFAYSCAGFITLGLLAEQLTGKPLDDVVQRLVCEPLGLTRTSFRPLDRLDDIAPAQIAATECYDDSDHRGVVHDETATSLGAVAGNAGLFGTAADLLRFGRFFLDGTAAVATPLSDEGRAEMLRPQLPETIENDYQSGLGFRIDDQGFMGSLVGRGTAYGHTGFTGTSLVVDHDRGLVLAVLTNRVHPSREWSELQPFRRAVADLVA